MKKQPLGQNFLVDEGIAREIVHLAGVTPDRPVLEIGPGKGILTGPLLEQAGSITAIEIDARLCRALTDRFGSNENFRLIEADALKYDYGSLGNGTQVVSNLPYYAATHILKRLIHYRSHIARMTVMLQKEVANRLAAWPGTRDYGSLSVFVQFYCNVEKLLDVGKEAFSPKPKIDSAVVQLTPLARPKVQVDHQKTFFNIVNAAFLHKRKMLKNNLKGWKNMFCKENGRAQLAGIDLSRRGETLSLDDFAALANHIHSRHDG
ncbi:ribosomal RNA small subunit methyltransferase A [Candidatus Nitromaritima sp. SCGC AAA799-C22]|nr:ribosomal RNA small subunit methyltransferase A [Candidatus Nitromaritima sp. SCGC AAA799-C22]